MSTNLLGGEFDLHCGGQDLVFPHHEDEIAQARGAGYGFARYWMHNGFLNIDDEKMSKSLGNFFTLREIFKDFDPLAVRFFLISAHYRAPLNFSREALEQAVNGLERFNNFILRLQEAAGEMESGAGAVSPGLRGAVQQIKDKFNEGMDDDLNVSRSLAALADLVREMNIRLDESRISGGEAVYLIDFFREMDEVLGVFRFQREILPEEIEQLIQERVEARKRRDFARADQIRDQLAEQGVMLEDTKEGTRWVRR
jgi:cysteinyl-tRNA synthetase